MTGVQTCALPICFPVTIAFVYLTLKYILAGVTNSINSISSIITQLEKRVETMNTQLQRIDIKVTHSLGLEPDYDRIARAEKDDIRKD